MIMEKQTTHVAIILDRSGSMWRTKTATVRGYNEQVQQIKEDAQDENHDIFVSLVTFNGSVTEHLWCVPAEQLEEADEEDFIPKGTTALRDAMGHTIQKLLDTTDSEDKDTAYLICLISDGEELSSKHFSKDALRELTESVQNSDRWTINYMGCDESYLKKIAQETAVPIDNCAVWANDTAQNTEFAMKEMGGKLGGYFGMRSSGGGTSSKAFHNDTGKKGACADYSGKGNKPSIDVFRPVDKQAIFDNLKMPVNEWKMHNPSQDFSIGENRIKPLSEDAKLRTNVFGVGSKVESEVWAKYADSRTCGH
jgi:uncharacterized protein YegL